MNSRIVIISSIVFLSLLLLITVVFNKSVSKGSLEDYLSRLFPTTDIKKISSEDKERIYLNLDCWYTDIIQKYEQQIKDKQPNWFTDRMDIWSDKPDEWGKLFDGSVCDCMRAAYPVCKDESRFGGEDQLSNCPNWPGMVVGKTDDTTLIQAYVTNNTDNNWIRDDYSTGKGFPNYSWVECLSYPGEYGHPEICGAKTPTLDQTQPGLMYKTKDTDWKWKPLDIKYKNGPWWSGGKCGSNDYCKYEWMSCATVKSDGQFPVDDPKEGKYCLNSSLLEVKEDYIDFDDCSKFPDQICKGPDTDSYHGLWLYPLRGVGMWRNIGNSVVCNTKLGYLLSPKENKNGGDTPLGAGYELEDILLMVGSGAGGPQNINKQADRLTKIIMNGYAASDYNYSYMTISTLREHGFKGDIIPEYSDARKAALSLMKKWYIEGYSGMLDEDNSPNGYNYNYKKYFPIGTHFGYASGLDVAVLATMVINKIDTLQLVLEPQAAKAGLRPAYLFELFQATPSYNSDSSWSEFKKDTNQNQCKEFYMIDPTVDLANYLTYGYVAKEHVRDRQVFDPTKMTLTSVDVSFP